MDVGLVCDACSTFNPMGASSCSRCSEPLALDPPERRTTPEPRTGFENEPTVAGPGMGPIPPATVPCPSCGEEVTYGHKFCGQCGTRMPGAGKSANGRVARSSRDSGRAGGYDQESGPHGFLALEGRRRPDPAARGAKRTLFFSAMQAARAKLVLISGDGLDGVSFTLAGEQHIAGREDAPLLFEDDPFISPTHANFFYRSGELIVSDESSVNGIYLRIQGSVELHFGDRFLVGEQLIEVQATPDEREPEAVDDGTYFFASPRRTSRFRLVQALRGGGTGLAFCAQSDTVTLGREDNDINFPDDPFISGRHAQVTYADGQLSVTDLGSKNGTFLRINGECPLSHGDYVFMGQQLLRVEIV